MAEHRVKAICGKFTTEDGIMAPGEYYTAINIYNPSPTVQAQINVSLVIAAIAGSAAPVPPIAVAPLKIPPLRALEIDCPYVMKFAKPGLGAKQYFKGFVILKCEIVLEVVAVYTAATLQGAVATLDVERVLESHA